MLVESKRFCSGTGRVVCYRVVSDKVIFEQRHEGDEEMSHWLL